MMVQRLLNFIQHFYYLLGVLLLLIKSSLIFGSFKVNFRSNVFNSYRELFLHLDKQFSQILFFIIDISLSIICHQQILIRRAPIQLFLKRYKSSIFSNHRSFFLVACLFTYFIDLSKGLRNNGNKQVKHNDHIEDGTENEENVDIHLCDRAYII